MRPATASSARAELPAADGAGCPVCPHETDAHDTIASRFCAATAAAGHDRGCVCAAGSPESGKGAG
ncbi:RGCVC family protein [Amycolatopsis halotolerans]|uniref:RGCVC family protein n=1 Tax=Amycolatopsis halotolerans TaxID=330083 RepID=A0ABV7QA99_9PSEU